MNRIAVLLISCAALAACNKDGGAKPEGQVAATVDGKEVTTSEVRLELGSLAGDPQAVAQQQPAALRAVVNRKLLADAAEEKGLDKSPEGAMVLQKARELALIQLLQNSIVKSVPKVTADQASEYVRNNPNLFAQRRVILLDQLQVPQIPPAVIQQMRPLKTIEDVAKLLDDNKIPYRRGNGAIDPLAIDPQVLKQILANGENEVFVAPAQQGVQVARITGYRDAPLAGNEAQQAATAVLSQRQTVGQVRQQFEGIIKNGQKDVKINDAYKPKDAPAAAGAAKAS
jgi:EpsD family peptidyl-prolyl cis-trans isomerase